MGTAYIHYVYRIRKMQFSCADLCLAKHIHIWFNALRIQAWYSTCLVAESRSFLPYFHYSSKKLSCLRVVN